MRKARRPAMLAQDLLVVSSDLPHKLDLYETLKSIPSYISQARQDGGIFEQLEIREQVTDARIWAVTSESSSNVYA